MVMPTFSRNRSEREGMPAEASSDAMHGVKGRRQGYFSAGTVRDLADKIFE